MCGSTTEWPCALQCSPSKPSRRPRPSDAAARRKRPELSPSGDLEFWAGLQRLSFDPMAVAWLLVSPARHVMGVAYGQASVNAPVPQSLAPMAQALHQKGRFATRFAPARDVLMENHWGSSK